MRASALEEVLRNWLGSWGDVEREAASEFDEASLNSGLLSSAGRNTCVVPNADGDDASAESHLAAA